MSWFLNVIYLGCLALLSPWLMWRAVFSGKNRRGWNHKLLGWVKPRKSAAPCVWLHAVSVGEVNLLIPIMEQLAARRPDLEFVISTTTETGFDLAQKKYANKYVFFCPMDFTWAIQRVLKRLNPSLLVLAELELWPNLIRTTRRSGVDVAVVNGRLSENSFQGYQRLAWLIRRTFGQLSLVAAQNDTYAQRFLRLGCDRATLAVTGNVKFDGAETDRSNARTIELCDLARIDSTEQVFVAGSTQLEEDLIAAEVYRRLLPTFPDMRLILVPRHPERCDVLIHQLRQIGLPVVRRSALTIADGIGDSDSDRGSAAGAGIRAILIVDVIGELGAWWGRADAAYVGGSMGRRGGQNMIEPAAFGTPVSFGPHTENFRDIVSDLLSTEAAVEVDDAEQLAAFVRRAFSDGQWAAEIGARARNVVLDHVGASQRTADALCELLAKQRHESKNSVGHARAA